MTKALRDAFEEAEKLPEVEQDQLAAAIREEITYVRTRAVLWPVDTLVVRHGGFGTA